MHIQASRHHHKRADAALTLLQDSTALVATQDANTRSLALDEGASTILNTVTGIPLVVDGTTTLTQVIATPTPSPTPVSSSEDTSPTETPTSSSSSHGPSLTTVVAACIGAFIGAAILIVSAVYLYKRYTGSQERAMRRRRAARVAEQQHNEKQRPNGNGNGNPPRSPGPPQIGDIGMGEKIDLSQPSPSMHSDFSHAGSAEAELAAKFTASQQNLALPSSRSPPTRQDTSWSAHSGTATDDSFLSLRSVSAPSSVAKTTPLATVYDHMYHAESAAVVVDPFQDGSAELERAGPQVPAAAMTKAPRNGSGSSQSNPFADAHAAKARAMGHRPQVNVSTATSQSAYSNHSGSAAGSVSSNPEQAMQNLIAALDLPPAQVEERLRVASMQPSIMSDITTGYEEIDAESFPLPPSSNGHSHA